MILAGIDEAGYGPTLGPLVVSMSAFRVPEGLQPGSAPIAEAAPPAAPAPSLSRAPDLWAALEEAVTRKPDGARAPVNDSKKLFQQKRGVIHLEEGLLPFLLLKQDGVPRTLRALLWAIARRGRRPVSGTRPGADAYLDAYPWYRGRDLDLPIESFTNLIQKRAGRLRGALGQIGVEFLGVASRPLEVLEFNDGVEALENKAAVSFSAVAAFIGRLWRQYPEESVDVYVDRQGGRFHYASILFRALKPRSIRILEETESTSSYEIVRRGAPESPHRFRVIFATECEEHCLPVALASMASKYVREAHMILFNRFWQGEVAHLKPTAGYAVDARRFLQDIDARRRSLSIGDQLLIRKR